MVRKKRIGLSLSFSLVCHACTFGGRINKKSVFSVSEKDSYVELTFPVVMNIPPPMYKDNNDALNDKLYFDLPIEPH